MLEGDELVGILTETDVLASLFEKRCTMETVIGEVMCRRVSTVSVNDEAQALADVFTRGETALVVDDHGKLTGLISKLDLIEHLAHGNPLEEAAAG